MPLSGSKVIPKTVARPSAERGSLGKPKGEGLEEGRNAVQGPSEVPGTHQMGSTSDGASGAGTVPEPALHWPPPCNKRKFCLF